MKPKVSVLITTYNRPEVLVKRALPSVLGQTFKDLEIIIVDDGSRQTPKLPLNPRIKYVWQENRGIAAARNKAVSLARGEYVVFIDDDNMLDSKFLEKTVPMLQNAPPSVGGIQTGRIIMGEHTSYAKPIIGTFPSSIDWGWLLRRSVFDKIKYDEIMYADEDMDLGIQFAQHYKKLIVDEPLQIAYPNDNDSICAPTPRRLRGLEKFLEKNLAFYKKDRNELRYLYRLAGRNFYHGGYRLKGIGYFCKSFWAQKNFKTLLHLMCILLGWHVYNAFMNFTEHYALTHQQ